MSGEPRKIMVSDLSYDQAEIDAVVSVLKSKWLTMGPKTQEFEENLARYLNVDHVIAVNSGTAALHLALLTLDIKPCDEVIVPPITFVATANVIGYLGAVPVFADIDPETFNIDPECIRKSVTKKTKAIIPVHLAGNPIQMDEIIEIADEYHLGVLDDAAHAIGAEYHGAKIGSIGTITAFSFFSNKNLSVGEGGAIATNDSTIAARLKLLRSHGLTKPTWSRHKAKEEESYDQLYDMFELGYNYRINEMCAALGCVQLEQLDKFIDRRTELYKYYRDLTENIPITFQTISSDVKHAHHVLPILVSESKRSKVRSYLQSSGISTSIHYTPIYKFGYYKERGYSNKNLESSEDMGKRVITLPLHPNLQESDVQLVVSELKKAL